MGPLYLLSKRLTPGYLIQRKLKARVCQQIKTMSSERTFIAVKPDGVQRGLVGEIIQRFEHRGFKICGMKFMQGTQEHFEKHYADLSHLPFYGGLVKSMASSPVLAMCWEGTNVVKTARKIIHGSDSVESANKEIALWFKPEELVSWTQS